MVIMVVKEHFTTVRVATEEEIETDLADGEDSDMDSLCMAMVMA